MVVVIIMKVFWLCFLDLLFNVDVDIIYLLLDDLIKFIFEIYLWFKFVLNMFKYLFNCRFVFGLIRYIFVVVKNCFLLIGYC